MAKNTGEERRIFLFKNFGKYIKVNYKNKPTSLVDLNLGEEAPKGAGWNKFIEMYFSDENGVLDFFKDIKKLYGLFSGQNQTTLQSLVPKVNLQQNDPTNMFIFYACDLDWAKDIGYCNGGNSSTTNLEDKVGTYTTDNSIVKKIKITKVSDPNDTTKDYFQLVSVGFGKIPVPKINDFIECKLVPSSDGSNSYSITSVSTDSTLDNVITFTSDGFVFDYKDPLTKKVSLYKLKATKVSGGTTDPVTPPNPDEKKKPTPAEKEKEEIPVVRTNTLHFNNDKKTYVATKKCDDFPFSLGCSNKLIGDLNASLFNGDRRNDVYNDGLQNLLDNSGSFGVNSNMEITKEIYDDVMNRLRKNNIIKETVKKVLKEYIIKK
jgi:hypothetical protein